MSTLLHTDHPYFFAIRTLRYERDAIETQMITSFHAYRDYQQSGHSQGAKAMAAHAHRLRRLAVERRQLRAAMRGLAASGLQGKGQGA